MDENRDAHCGTKWIAFEQVMIERLPWLRRSTKTRLVAMTCSLLITAYLEGTSPLSR